MKISHTTSIHLVKVLEYDLKAGTANLGADDRELNVVNLNLRTAMGDVNLSEPIVVKLEELGQLDGEPLYKLQQVFRLTSTWLDQESAPYSPAG